MSSFKIFTESTADLTQEMAEKTQVHVIPLSFSFDDKEYKNTPTKQEMSNKEFYEKMRQGSMPTTSQVNAEEFKEYAKPLLDQGFDILHLAFSSALSGTYNSCRLAAGELAEEYPDRRVVVVDTLCASLGEGLLVYLSAMKQQEGATMDEVIDFVEQNKMKVNHWFTVDDLNHLHRGGRVSKVTAVAGSMLGIKPIMRVNDDGKLVPVDKVRGRKKSLDKLVQMVAERATNPQEQIIFITHGDCAEDCEYVAETIKSTLNVKEVYTNYVGPSIGAHSGPGTMAVFFFGENRDV